MKHPASSALFAYWNACRGEAAAPPRSAFDPAAVREFLGDIFVAGPDASGAIRFRVAGTRACALFGRELKATAFEAIWRQPDRARTRDLADIVVGEHQACIIGADGHDRTGAARAVELLLLPFEHHFPGIATFTGAILPVSPATPALPAAVHELSLSSWRWIETSPAPGAAPRPHQPARGFTLYQTVPGARPAARIFRGVTR